MIRRDAGMFLPGDVMISRAIGKLLLDDVMIRHTVGTVLPGGMMIRRIDGPHHPGDVMTFHDVGIFLPGGAMALLIGGTLLPVIGMILLVTCRMSWFKTEWTACERIAVTGSETGRVVQVLWVRSALVGRSVRLCSLTDSEWVRESRSTMATTNRRPS